MILCPYHIEKIKPRLVMQEKARFYTCPICDEKIPREYVEEKNIPKSMIEVVGFPGHGKYHYLYSLFSILKKLEEESKNYSFRGLDDYTLGFLFPGGGEFRGDSWHPEATRARPLLIRHYNIPYWGNWFTCIYELSGAFFENPEHMHGIPVRVTAHSDVTLFIISILDCGEDWIHRMVMFLDIYIHALRYMQVNLKRKHLIVVLTKADLLINKGFSIQLSPELVRYITEDSYKEYLDLDKKYLKRLKESSGLIRRWLIEKGCRGFIYIAEDNFKSVEYTIVSSSGFTPVGQQLATTLNPIKVLDPFLWALEKTYPKVKNIFLVRLFKLFKMEG